MLLKNKRSIYETPWNQFWGALVNERNNFIKEYTNRYISEDGWVWNKKASIPLGTEAIYSYQLAVKGGEMVTHTISWLWVLSWYQKNGINIATNLLWSGNITWSISLIIWMLSSINGSGQVNWWLSLLIKMATNLAGIWQLSASLSLLAGITTILNGTGNLQWSLRATMDMATDITPFTELSPQNLSQAVWEYYQRTLTWWVNVENMDIWVYNNISSSIRNELSPELANINIIPALL